MHPTEFYWQCEARRPKRMYGSMTEDEVQDIFEYMQDEGIL